MSEETIEQYNHKADRYEQSWQKYLNHTHGALLDRIHIDATDTILDVSGGTGLLVQHALERGYSFDRFIINDPSERMLAVARRRFADNEKIDFGNERVDELSYEPDSFDKIICLNSFHFYQHQQQVSDRFHQILKPGGLLYILDWNREGLFRIFNRIIKWVSAENIDTRSLSELAEMVRESSFALQSSDCWYWRYWHFLFIEAKKSET